MADDLEDIRKALALNTPGGSSSRPNAVQNYILTPFGKILDALDTDLNLVTQSFRPIATSLNPNLEQVYQEKGFNVTPSDLIEKSLENAPLKKILSPVLGFAANVVLSPTTYLAGIGTLTKAGKLFQKVSSLSDAKQTIKLDSDIARAIAKHYGEKTITPTLINRAVKEAKAFSVASLSQQTKMGHRALINIGVPFTKSEIPALKSELFFRGVEKSTDLLKSNKSTAKVGEAFTRMFSTSSGNAKFDRIRQSLVGLLKYNIEDVRTFGTKTGKLIDKVSKEYGISRDDAFRMLTDIAENPFRGDISAKNFLDTFGPQIEKQVVNLQPIEKIINDLPGIQSVTMDERQKLFNNLLRIAKEKQAGFDVFTVGFRQLPEDVRSVFIKEWTEGIGIKFANDIKQGIVQFADFRTVFKAYDRGINYKGIKIEAGEEAALYALVGKDEYLRLKNKTVELARVAKALAVPSEVQGSAEWSQLLDVVHRVRGHVDQGFTTAYTLFKNSPDYLKEISPRLHKLMILIDSKSEWKITSLTEQFHVPLALATKYPKLFDLAQNVRKFMQENLQLEQQAGVSVAEFIGDISYIPHIPTKEVRQLLAKNYGDFSDGVREWNRDHQNTLMRKYFRNINSRAVEELFNTGEITARQRKVLLGKRGLEHSERLQKKFKWSDAKTAKLYKYLTVTEVNAMAKRGDLKLLGPGVKIERFFEENPASQILIRGIRGAKARTSMDFYDAASGFGKWHNINDPLPEGMSFVKNEKANPLAEARTSTKLVKGQKVVITERMIFDKGIAKHIDKLHESLVLPPDLHPLLKVYDGMQSEWKAWTLSIFPAYHIRNFVGNLWNNYLAGIHTPEPYMKALNIQRGKNITITLGSGQKLNSKQIYELAAKNDLLRTGQFWGDIREYYEAELTTGLKKYYGKYVRPPVGWGLKVGNYVENNSKLALFIRRLEEGHSVESAAMEVRKYLFDYTNLTTAEREGLRRLFPFYSWTRFNVPLQLEALLTHPARLMTVAKAKNAIESNYDGVPEERLLPDYYVQNFPVRVRYDKGSGQFQYLMLNNWLPAADIDKIFDPVTWVKNQITPLLKEPAQQMLNRDAFTNREIDRGDEYQTIKILGMNLNLPARQAHAIKNIRLISELDKLSDTETPISERAGRLISGKLYGFNEEQQRKYEKLSYREKKSQLRSMIHKAREKGNLSEEKRLTKKLEELREKHSSKI